MNCSNAQISYKSVRGFSAFQLAFERLLLSCFGASSGCTVSGEIITASTYSTQQPNLIASGPYRGLQCRRGYPVETRAAIKEFRWAIRPKLAPGDARTAAMVSRTPHSSLPSHTTRHSQPGLPMTPANRP